VGDLIILRLNFIVFTIDYLFPNKLKMIAKNNIANTDIRKMNAVIVADIARIIFANLTFFKFCK